MSKPKQIGTMYEQMASVYRVNSDETVDYLGKCLDTPKCIGEMLTRHWTDDGCIKVESIVSKRSISTASLKRAGYKFNPYTGHKI